VTVCEFHGVFYSCPLAGYFIGECIHDGHPGVVLILCLDRFSRCQIPNPDSLARLEFRVSPVRCMALMD
jgi:hypothetical protein